MSEALTAALRSLVLIAPLLLARFLVRCLLALGYA